MKKIIALVLLLGMMSIPAYSQEKKGDMEVGVHLGLTSHINFGFGADFKYCVADHWRIAPELTYFLRHNTLSNFQIAVDCHYVMSVPETNFSFYPLAGIGLGFWNYQYGGSTTRFMIDLGLGMQYDIDANWGVKATFKQQWMSDFSMGTFLVGGVYRF